jgi:radical SAM protein with 4Fe4S-binding SPASM domain
LKNRNTHILITTSGFYLNDSVKKSIKLLSGAKATIQPIIDGLAQTHNYIRGHTDAFERWQSSFWLMRRDMSMISQVATVLINQKHSEIDELCKLVKKLGIKTHRFGTLSNRGRAYKNNLKTAMQYKDLGRFIQKQRIKFGDDNYAIMASEELSKSKEVNCGAGFRLYKITPDFRLYPCAMMDYEIGDLNTYGLEELLEKSSNIFPTLDRPCSKVCGKCKFINLCRNCPSEGLVNRKHINTCKWFDYANSILSIS